MTHSTEDLNWDIEENKDLETKCGLSVISYA